jgi:chemotaxis protein MotA
VIGGILSIQACDNPRVVQEKLITFVPPALRAGADAESNGGEAAKAAA